MNCLQVQAVNLNIRNHEKNAIKRTACIAKAKLLVRNFIETKLPAFQQ